MKKYIFILLLLASHFTFSQVTEGQVLQEAKARNITNRNQAMDAMKANGISEAQARQMARKQGINYDDFLNSYFPNQENKTSDPSNEDPDSSFLEESSDDDSVDDESVDDETVDDETVDDELEDEVIKTSALKSRGNYFGYNIFNKNPFLEKEYLLGNIDEGYLISPGDKLRLIVFGTNSLEMEATVDRNGNINIPNYGLFFAAGNTFKTLKSRLQNYLGKYFSGLISNPQSAFLDVSLTQLRPTKVIVMGQVGAPGPQLLTTQANPLAALYAAGGVTVEGSLRTIKIYRNNQLIHTLDLYDYITTGKLSKDISLTNNDVVFVPPRISSMALTGAVKNQGIYELKPNEGLKDLIHYSGGLPATAIKNKVNIKRIKLQSETEFNRELITINYEQALSQNKMVPLNDLDVIKFFSILDIVENIVSIQGNVYQPGEYALSQYPTLNALITDAAKGILIDTYLKKVDVIGLLLPEEEIGLTSYNLSDILSGKVNVLLKENDMVTIYSKAQIEGNGGITISGYGVTGGTKNYPWLENQSLYDLIFINTAFEDPDFTTNVLSSRLDLMRLNKATGFYKTQSYNLTNLEQLKKTMLDPYDKVILFNKGVNERINKRISVGGFVKNPSEMRLQEQMYVEDALLLAGGFDELADKDMVYLNREDIDPLTENISTLYTLEIDKDYLLGKTDKPSNGFILMDRDIISVRKKLGIEPRTVINLKGELNYPRSFIGEFEQISYKDLINAGGGLTQNALLEASTVVRDGRLLAVDLSTINKNQQVFESGDIVTFAKNRGEVSVSGAIEQENYFIWEADKKAKYYIKNSGGKIRGEADESYVSLPNGKTKKINFFNNPRVLPNSEIVVTRKVKKERVRSEDGLTRVLSVASILVTLLTSVVLVRSL
ncbi:MAG: hypothetical protein HOB16_09055 [Flavobacteriaceae bacterium]|nr:hypothetical protein [Flavobacteriaceae bacterium]